MAECTPTYPFPGGLAGTTVLVTEGAGFVGSHLVDALAGECDVIVLDDMSRGDPRNVPAGATVLAGDVRTDEDVRAATSSSTRQARRELGFEPTVTLEEGLRSLVSGR